MQGFDYKNKEKRWRAYHRFEEKNKSLFLRKLSQRDSFNLLKELYSSAYNLTDISSYRAADENKIKILAKMHSLFGRIKI